MAALARSGAMLREECRALKERHTDTYRHTQTYTHRHTHTRHTQIDFHALRVGREQMVVALEEDVRRVARVLSPLLRPVRGPVRHHLRVFM